MGVLQDIYFIGKDILKEGYKFISPKISYKKFEKNMEEKYIQPIQKLLDESDEQPAANTIYKILAKIKDSRNDIEPRINTEKGKKLLLLQGIKQIYDSITSLPVVFVDTIDDYKDEKYDAEYRERLNRIKNIMQYWNDNKEDYLKNKIVLRFDKCNKEES